MANEYNPTTVSPPGGTIADIIEERGLDADQVALFLGLSRQELDGLLRGELVINEGLAQKLEDALGVTHRFWIARERRYREWVNSARGTV